MNILAFLIGAATGIISGFGIGGGSLLVLYLTTIGGVAQQTAGGINLLYFIGCAPVALIGHIRHKLIVWQAVWWCTLAGIVIAIPTAILSHRIAAPLLRRMFGIVCLYIGIKEWRAGSKKRNK